MSLFIVPVLELGHPDDLPRFRDASFSEAGEIAIYTRVGGGNRNAGFGEEVFENHPDFLDSEDDEFDSTYATYYFSVPDKWADDLYNALDGKFSEVSPEYKELVKKTFPKIEGLDELFSKDRQ